jgi:hypothetical protein
MLNISFTSLCTCQRQSTGERNPIEGKFGQAKTAYGLNRIKAQLKETSESWIAGIFMVLNLVKLAGVVFPCLLLNMETSLTALRLPLHFGRTHPLPVGFNGG